MHTSFARNSAHVKLPDNLRSCAIFDRCDGIDALIYLEFITHINTFYLKTVRLSE